MTAGAPCRVCEAIAHPIHIGVIFNRPVQYFECPRCRYVETETPDWLERAYSAAINATDTGLLARNLGNGRWVLGVLWLLGGLSARVVDQAGGYGVLVRRLRDEGVDAYWADAYCENLLARGFEHHGESAGLVTAFEAVEHFLNPVTEFARMFEIAPNVLISTELMATPAPDPAAWWYYGTEHGQHIGFFRRETLEWLAARFGKHLCTDGRSLHLLTDRPVSRGRWWLVRHAPRLVSLLARRSLVSKTWADHETLKKRLQ